jgi:hypothetical protein
VRLIVVGLLLLARGTPAEVKADFAMICNAPKRAGADKEKDPREKARRIADYLLSHLRTTQAMEVMRSMAELPPSEKAAALRKAARASGYHGPCPFADES